MNKKIETDTSNTCINTTTVNRYCLKNHLRKFSYTQTTFNRAPSSLCRLESLQETGLYCISFSSKGGGDSLINA